MSAPLPRGYEDIVRDLLTTLTGGTVRETLDVPADPGPLRLARLRDRPVRRVSHLEGKVTFGARPVDYRFTAADFELTASSPGSDELDAIAFREGGRRPDAGTTLTVNYYPVQTPPVPLTDLNVGSVTRTLVETVARELALAHLQLQHIYDSAFVDTAEGSSLDKVVALVGAMRLPAGHPVARLLFTRRAGVPGQINVPAGTAVTDAAGNRYLTTTPLTLDPGESAREVAARGETPATPAVEQDALNRPEVLIAGIESVSNPQPARALEVAETDAELRTRARSALHGVVRGTPDALRFGLMSLPGVTKVTLHEPDETPPGTVLIDVAYSDDSPEVRAQVQRTIDLVRPAGIRVGPPRDATRRRVGVRLGLTFAGAGPATGDVPALTATIEREIAEYLASLPPGGAARGARLTAIVMTHPELLDADIQLVADGAEPGPELTLRDGEVIDLVRPFAFTTTSEAGGAGGAPARVTFAPMLQLVGVTTLAEAQRALEQAVDVHLATRGPQTPLTFDSLAAAARDDSRYVIVREASTLVAETGDRFLQLVDGSGSFQPAAGQNVQRAAVNATPGGTS